MNIKPRIALFCYNFPHKKTQDFLLRFFLEGIELECILAADPVQLNIPPASIRTKIKHSALVHPKIIAERISAAYYVVPHNSLEASQLLEERGINLGIISGARILKPYIINKCSMGIINFHPGLIPEARGLDAMLWSILKGIPLGVTVHLIDQFVDAGYILIKQRIPIYEDDTIYDLSERLYEKQLELILPAIKAVVSGDKYQVNGSLPYFRKMPPELEKQALLSLPKYIKSFKTQ